jgi:hypothetical protein
MSVKGSVDSIGAVGKETPDTSKLKGKGGKKGLKNTRIETPFYYRSGKVSIVAIPVHSAVSLKLPQVTEEQVEGLKKDGTLKNPVAVKHGKSVKVQHGTAGGEKDTKAERATLMVPSSANNSDIAHHFKKINADHQTNIHWFQQGTGRKIWVKKLDNLEQAKAGG